MSKCCKMNSGMLKEPVQFERKTRTSDGAGGFTETWAAISGAPTRCSVKAMSGSERWASQRVEATSTHKITIRYTSDLTEVDRAVIRGRIYNIRFIDNLDFADKWLEVRVNLGVAV